MDSETAATQRGFLFTATALFTVLLTTLGGQLPVNMSPAWLTSQWHGYRILWPQDWTFFADTLQVDTIVAYRTGPDGTTPQTAIYPHMSAQNLWGLSRVAYAQIPEARQIAAQVPAGGWRDCDGTADSGCLRPSNSAQRHEVTNEFWHPTLCGSLTLAVEAPAAWRTKRGAGQRPRAIQRTAEVRVRCFTRDAQ
jgi:antimicrobial peptide system SdpA family protein